MIVFSVVPSAPTSVTLYEGCSIELVDQVIHDVGENDFIARLVVQETGDKATAWGEVETVNSTSSLYRKVCLVGRRPPRLPAQNEQAYFWTTIVVRHLE